MKTVIIFSTVLAASLLLVAPEKGFTVGPPPPPVQVRPVRQSPVIFDEAGSRSEIAQLREFLSRFPTIRFYIVNSPGNGHQAANIRAIKRLREFGYQGVVQVIYHDGNLTKLPYLIPGFDPARKELQTVSSESLGSLELVAESASAPIVKASQLPLGISGANDQETSRFDLSRLNVGNLLQLQPRLWAQRRSKREIILKTNEAISLEHLSSLGTATFAEPIGNWSEALQKYLSQRPELRVKIPLMQALGSEFEKVDILPAYSIDFPFSTDKLAAKVFGGLIEARTRRPDLFQRPIVVPVFTEFKEEKKRNAFAGKLAELKIQYLSYESADAVSTLRSAKAGEIVVLQIGAVPPAIFDGLFTRATLPALLEGKNLTNTMIDRGLPFINVVGSRVDIEGETRGRLAPEAQNILSNVFYAFDERQFGNNIPFGVNALASYFIELREPRSQLRPFFASLTNDPRSLNRDLMGQALIELRSAMNQRGLVP